MKVKKRPKPAGFAHGLRKVGYTRETSGPVRTVYSRDPDRIGESTCIRCSARYRGDVCPICKR